MENLKLACNKKKAARGQDMKFQGIKTVKIFVS